MISRLKRLYDDVTNWNKRLEVEINDLNEDLEKSNKKNEGLEAEIFSLRADLEASNKKNKEPLQSFEKEGLEA